MGFSGMSFIGKLNVSLKLDIVILEDLYQSLLAVKLAFSKTR